MIINAFKNAYKKMQERKWDTIYIAIDLHGTCLKSNYKNGGYEFINEHVKLALQLMAAQKESVIILWSGCHEEQKKEITQFFEDNVIRVDFFNENPLEKSTETGNFAEKFYFSVLLDDKAGFDPDTDWVSISNFYKMMNKA